MAQSRFLNSEWQEIFAANQQHFSALVGDRFWRCPGPLFSSKFKAENNKARKLEMGPVFMKEDVNHNDKAFDVMALTLGG